MNSFIPIKHKLKIISHGERRAHVHPVKMGIFGPPGIGKTSLLKTLDEPTLCIDLEAGLLAVQDWQGDVVCIRTWEEARNIACLLGGPNPALKHGMPYSVSDYEKVCKEYGEPEQFAPYKCIFIDSLTVASRFCFQWAQQQPECNKSGRIDTRAAYGLLGREMIAWITQIQYIKNRDIIMVGILEEKVIEDEDVTRTKWGLQCEGKKTSEELPGILDEILCMVALPGNNKNELKRTFVCDELNQHKYPAKDRSGKLSVYEEAHLGNVLKKIKSMSEDVFVFQSNGNSKKLFIHEVAPYLNSLAETLNTTDKIEKFKQWANNNKDTLDKFYKQSPEYKGHLEHLIIMAEEIIKTLEGRDTKQDDVTDNLINLAKKVK